jgi:hypothetical protein
MTPAWATVALSLGAAGITALAGFGTILWQQRMLAQAAVSERTSAAYQALIAHSLSFIIRAQTLKALVEQKSAVIDRLDLEIRSQFPGPLATHMRTRQSLDLLTLHDWLAESFDPVNSAWATVKVFGSPPVVTSADKLVAACSTCLGAATQVGTARGKVGTLLLGVKWTPEQRLAFDNTLKDLGVARDAFILLANREFAAEPRRRLLRPAG